MQNDGFMVFVSNVTSLCRNTNIRHTHTIYRFQEKVEKMFIDDETVASKIINKILPRQ